MDVNKLRSREFKINELITAQLNKEFDKIDSLFKLAVSQGTITSTENNPCLYMINDNIYSYVIDYYNTELKQFHIYWIHRDDCDYDVDEYEDFLGTKDLDIIDKIFILLNAYSKYIY